MALLKYLHDTPPSGFWYLQRETRLRIEGESLRDLTAKVIAHRKYKALTPIDEATVALEVERQICSRLGIYHCKPEGPDDKWQPSQMTNTVLRASSVVKASKVAWAWLKSGRELVPEAQAQSRATGCAGCPLNWALTGCKCGSIYKRIEKAVPKEKRFANLGVCTVCQCSLPAKVWLPMSVIGKQNLPFPQDGSCWQYNESEG